MQRITLWGDGHRYGFFVCPTCGALVADAPLHDAWHLRLQRAIPAIRDRDAGEEAGDERGRRD